MPDPILRGTTDPQRQKRVWTQNLQSGGSYAEHYKGLSLAKMQTLQNSVLWTARNSTLTESAGVCELTIEWGADGGGGGSTSSKSITVDRWDCPEPKESKDLLSHPQFVATISGLVAASETAISDLVAITRSKATKAQTTEGSESMEVEFMTAFDKYLTDNAFTPSWSNNILRFYRLFANNQTHYQNSQYAVRHTTVAPSYWSANVADSNVNCILTHAQFISEAQDSDAWIFPLPGRMAYKLAAAVTYFNSITPARTAHQIGWLKSPSSEASVGRSRIEIQTTYVFDQWSTDIYPLAAF